MIGSDYVLEAHNIYHTAEVGVIVSNNDLFCSTCEFLCEG